MKIKKYISTKILKLLLIFLSIEITYCQLNKNAFTKLDAVIQYNQRINNTKLSKNWHIINGFTFYLQTPFYIGEILCGSNFMFYNSKFNKLLI